MGSTCTIFSFFKPTCQKQKASKICGNNTCQFQSLDVCARQFLWLFAGEKIGILPSRRLLSVTSLWVWFEWTTYRFSAGLAHTRTAHFPRRACVLIPEWTRLRAWKPSVFIWRDFPLGPLNLTASLWVWAWPWFRLSFTAWQKTPRCQRNRKWTLVFSFFSH